MRKLQTTKQFKKDLRRAFKRGKSPDKIGAIIHSLREDRKLQPRHHDHKLAGYYGDCRECHIEADWLLIYRKPEDSLVLIRTGTHSDLFNE